MNTDNLDNCFKKTFEIKLPVEGSFCLKNDNNFFISEYGPRILTHPAFEGYWTSQDVVIVGDELSGQYQLLGAVTAFRSFTYFFIHRHQGRFTSIIAIQPEIKTNEHSEEIIELRGNDWRSLLVEYANIAAKKMGVAKLNVGQNVTGYCSWYYYYFNVSQKQFLESVEASYNNSGDYKPKYMQIDDGYHTAYGDWLNRNPDWPEPLEETVKKVNDMGFDAGIWTMPFLADTESEVFKKHPDWFVHDYNDKPWYIRGWGIEPHHYWACLDFSRKDVQEHIRRVFETFYDWGFRYFKLDGGGFSAPSGKRSVPEATGVSSLRVGLRVLREAVRDSVVLGCAIPYLPSIGLVDHSRVSSDTGESWQMWGLPGQLPQNYDPSVPNPPGMPGLEHALQGTLSNWWMFDRWFRADPDVIIVRKERSQLTIGEARMSALSGIVTGIAITSDRLDKIDNERLAILKKSANIRITNLRPVEYKDKAWLNVFSGYIDGAYSVAIFNYSDIKRKWSLKDLGFTGSAEELLHPLGKINGSIEVPSHDAVLLRA